MGERSEVASRTIGSPASSAIDVIVEAITFGRTKNSGPVAIEFLLGLGYLDGDGAAVARIIRLLFAEGELIAASPSVPLPSGYGRRELVTIEKLYGCVKPLRALLDNGVRPRPALTVVYLASSVIESPVQDAFMRAMVCAGYVVDANDGSLEKLICADPIDDDRVRAVRFVLHHTTTEMERIDPDKLLIERRETPGFSVKLRGGWVSYNDDRKRTVVRMLVGYHDRLTAVKNFAMLHDAIKLPKSAMRDVWGYFYAPVY